LGPEAWEGNNRESKASSSHSTSAGATTSASSRHDAFLSPLHKQLTATMKQISTVAAIIIFIFSSVLSLPVTVLASKGGKLAPKPKTKAAKKSSAFSSLSYGGCGSYSYSMNCKQKPTSPSSFPPRSRIPSLSPSTRGEQTPA
jgi:hypothetical protein